MVEVYFYIYEGMKIVGTYEWYAPDDEEQANGFDDNGNLIRYYIA